MDYIDYYYLERYIFTTVNAHFKAQGWLSAFDFFCIVIWKANRAKSKIARRLLTKGYPNLEDAVRSLTQEIAQQESAKAMLRCLIRDWGFLMPMASAVLTVLYPEEFSIYDYRALQSLGSCPPVKIHRDFEKTWREYQYYLQVVKDAVPQHQSLRDKDRYLWGKSFHDQLRWDVNHEFNRGEAAE